MMSFEVTEKLRGRACACSCFSSIFPQGSMTEGKNLNWGSLLPLHQIMDNVLNIRC